MFGRRFPPPSTDAPRSRPTALRRGPGLRILGNPFRRVIGQARLPSCECSQVRAVNWCNRAGGWQPLQELHVVGADDVEQPARRSIWVSDRRRTVVASLRLNCTAQGRKLAQESLQRHFGLNDVTRTARCDQVLGIKPIWLPEPLPSDSMIHFKSECSRWLRSALLRIDAHFRKDRCLEDDCEVMLRSPAITIRRPRRSSTNGVRWLRIQCIVLSA